MVEILENSNRLKELKKGMEECGKVLEEKIDATHLAIQQINDRLTETIDENESRKLIECRKWLGALENADSEYRKNRMHLITEDSCTWILGTSQYQRFTDIQEYKHIWVYGKPGAGKSVLSSFVVRELLRNPLTELRVLRFFCKHDRPDSSTAAAVASNLVDQLIGQNALKPLFEILKQAFHKHAKSNQCTDFETLWSIFVKMVQAYPTRIVVIVDALDECLTDQVPFLDRVLELSSAAETRGKVRFFLTSREEHNISNKLGNHYSVLTLGMNVDHDIKNFVIQRVQELPGLGKFKEQIVEDVPKHSAGMFRYAALLLDQLDSPSTTSIPEMLKSSPKGLNEMYEHILLRLDKQNREIRKKILYWVGLAKRPLSVEELTYACAVRDDEENFDPSEKRLATEENILSYCGPLIEIVGGTVQFTHLTVREFLLQKGENLCHRGQVEYYLIQESEAHALIAISCSRLPAFLHSCLLVSTNQPLARCNWGIEKSHLPPTTHMYYTP
ncbi:hypothetical protein K440DRAFT_229355 [Wilcoxina mikolae CBS 423.85]|nr:hypothetical protein K440DRAFT_229355 [Wilcoxina mikolae CBS 423.85]